MIVRLDSAADTELSTAAAYLDIQKVGVGDRFIAAVVLAGAQLQAFPNSGQKLGRDVRRIIIKHFPYQLIYRVEGDEIVIYAVAHQKQRPGYWRKRVGPLR